jgi:hypothetical protein
MSAPVELHPTRASALACLAGKLHALALADPECEAFVSRLNADQRAFVVQRLLDNAYPAAEEQQGRMVALGELCFTAPGNFSLQFELFVLEGHSMALL